MKRLIRWKRNSWPFLSGDSFADFCDVNVTPPRFRGSIPSLDKISSAKSIFCNSDGLQDFLDKYHEIINAKIIVSGNSDHEFHEELKNVPISVRRFYLQNSFIQGSAKYRTIPIGIENFRYGVNGNPRHMKKKSAFHTRTNSVLFGPFSPTHPDREIALNAISENQFVAVYSERIEPKALSDLTQNFRFVAAVRGNGVDTHRIWESMYRGSIPIIVQNNWSSNFKSLSLPIEFIDGWTMKNLNECILSSVIQEFDPENLLPLWMPYWEGLMRADITD